MLRWLLFVGEARRARPEEGFAVRLVMASDNRLAFCGSSTSAQSDDCCLQNEKQPGIWLDDELSRNGKIGTQIVAAGAENWI